MASVTRWISREASVEWQELVFRAIEVAIITFVVLQLKELFEIGAFDTPASAGDAILIGAAVFVVNALIKLGKR
jgi:hypothetical protein